MGQAVDANVLIYERMREEIRRGAVPSRRWRRASPRPSRPSWTRTSRPSSWRPSCFFVGSGPIRGFAVTLAIGVVTTIITGVFVTRLMIALWFARTRPKTIVV
jgi:preprotein translocase subunit SecD